MPVPLWPDHAGIGKNPLFRGGGDGAFWSGLPALLPVFHPASPDEPYPGSAPEPASGYGLDSGVLLPVSRGRTASRSGSPSPDPVYGAVPGPLSHAVCGIPAFVKKITNSPVPFLLWMVPCLEAPSGNIRDQFRRNRPAVWKLYGSLTGPVFCQMFGKFQNCFRTRIQTCMVFESGKISFLLVFLFFSKESSPSPQRAATTWHITFPRTAQDPDHNTRSQTHHSSRSVKSFHHL